MEKQSRLEPTTHHHQHCTTPHFNTTPPLKTRRFANAGQGNLKHLLFIKFFNTTSLRQKNHQKPQQDLPRTETFHSSIRSTTFHKTNSSFFLTTAGAAWVCRSCVSGWAGLGSALLFLPASSRNPLNLNGIYNIHCSLQEDL